MNKSVRTVYIELRASADKLRADLDAAGAKLDGVKKAGSEAGKQISASFDEAHESISRLILRGAEAALVINKGVSVSKALLDNYRLLRLALSPTAFTATTLAMGVLVEETLRLTYARAKLIEQQSLLAATSGRSIGSVEQVAGAATVSGGNAATLQRLAGMTSEDLGDVARRFAAIEDPVKRAAEAVRVFGAANAGEALHELTAGFADASDATERYGATLNEVSRTQIFQFRQDILALKRSFTEYPEFRAFTEAFKTRMAEMGAAAEDVGKRGLKGLDDWIARITGLRGAALPPNTPPLGLRPGVENQIVAEDLTAQEWAARGRVSETIEGRRAAQAVAQKQADDLYKVLGDPAQRAKLSGDEQLALATQLQGARQRITSIGETIAAMEKAEEAQRKAAARAEELANFRAKSEERLSELRAQAIQRGLKTPIAQEMNRGAAEVLKDSDRTEQAEKEARAAIATNALRTVVLEEQAKFGKAWEAAVRENEKLRQDWFQFNLGRQISKDEAVVQANRGLGAVFTGNAIRMAQIGARPGDEAATAKTALDLKLKAVEAQRVANLTEAEALNLDREREAALAEYQETLAEVKKSLESRALAEGGELQQRLREYQRELEALRNIAVTSQNVADIEAARQRINEQIRQTQIDQLLRQGTLNDGWRAFWLEQQQQAEKPGQILYKGMNQALDGVAKNLADLGSGQNGNWGKTFQDIGRQMQEATIKSTLHQGLGALGRKFGIGDGKRDGQSRSGAIFVDIVGPGGVTTATTPASSIPGGGRGAGLGTIFGGGSSTNPFIFNYAASAYPGAASVPLRRDSSGTTETKGGDVTNIGPISVDARGADENSIYNRVFQAIQLAVGIAVNRSIAVGAERQQRIPQ